MDLGALGVDWCALGMGLGALVVDLHVAGPELRCPKIGERNRRSENRKWQMKQGGGWDGPKSENGSGHREMESGR